MEARADEFSGNTLTSPRVPDAILGICHLTNDAVFLNVAAMHQTSFIASPLLLPLGLLLRLPAHI